MQAMAGVEPLLDQKWLQGSGFGVSDLRWRNLRVLVCFVLQKKVPSLRPKALNTSVLTTPERFATAWTGDATTYDTSTMLVGNYVPALNLLCCSGATLNLKPFVSLTAFSTLHPAPQTLQRLVYHRELRPTPS